MKRVFKIAVAALAFIATGCSTYSLEELRHATPTGSPFQTALAKHYMEYSAEAEHDYDWPNSWHFADKGLVVVYGGDAGPEDLQDWDIPDDKLSDLQAARQQLMLALTPEKIAAQPQDAADAQFNFDCWVKEQEQNWREDHIARCRDGFEAALAALGRSGEKPLPMAKSKHEPKKTHKAPAKTAEEKPVESTPAEEAEEAKAELPKPRAKAEVEAYIVFFQGTDTALTESGKQVIAEVVQELSHQDHYEVVLHGHTDTTGTQEDDLKLSQSRSQAVKQELVNGGVKADSIKVFAFGKSDPPVKTADNVAEPANHRVEIFLNDGH